MSDDEHERLAREQDREVADMAEESSALQEEIEGAKEDLAGLDAQTGVATPDPAIEDVERRPGAGAEGPTQPAD